MTAPQAKQAGGDGDPVHQLDHPDRTPHPRGDPGRQEEAADEDHPKPGAHHHPGYSFCIPRPSPAVCVSPVVYSVGGPTNPKGTPVLTPRTPLGGEPAPSRT